MSDRWLRRTREALEKLSPEDRAAALHASGLLTDSAREELPLVHTVGLGRAPEGGDDTNDFGGVAGPPGGWEIRLYVSRKPPRSVLAALEDKEQLRSALPVRLIERAPAQAVGTAFAGECPSAEPVSDQPIRPGSEVHHRYANGGSVGCFCRRNGEEGIYLLSAYHVIGDLSLDPQYGRPVYLEEGDSEIPIGEQDQIPGALPPRRPSTPVLIDATVVRLSDCVSYETEIPTFGAVTAPWDLDELQAAVDHLPPGESLEVRYYGLTSGAKTAVIDDLVVNGHVTLHHRQLWFESQMSIKGTGIAQHGDSGSLVIDTENRPVGLLFATDFSNAGIGYVTPIQRIIDSLSITLLDQPPGEPVETT